MKKGVFLIICIGVAVVLSFLTYQFCSDRFGGKNKSYPAYLNFPSVSLPEVLGLKPEQCEKINALDENLSKDLMMLRRKITQERISLCGLMHKAVWDSNKVEEKMKAICELHAEQQKRVVEHLGKIKAVLTPEQEKKFLGLICKELCEGYRKECGETEKECLCDYHHSGRSE